MPPFSLDTSLNLRKPSVDVRNDTAVSVKLAPEAARSSVKRLDLSKLDAGNDGWHRTG
jgi:hypothetical protein